MEASAESKDAQEILKYITANSLIEIFPNLFIALRILLTSPISVASAERSFSKLKLIKNYLRSTMGQDRLSALALISIENKLSRSLDCSDLIDEFASLKVRKVKFLVNVIDPPKICEKNKWYCILSSPISASSSKIKKILNVHLKPMCVFCFVTF